MEEYTREQIQRADDTDLYVFLSGRGEQFKRCGKEYRWLRHDSVMINKNEWYRFSQNKGGHAIDFMKEFYGLSFAEAVKELLGEEGVGETNRRTAKEDAGRQRVCPIPLPGLELPERNESCEIARKYLIEQRKLSEHLVDQMIEKGDIYESKTITMWCSLEETKNRIPDMQLCGEPMRTDIVGKQKVRKKPMDLAM